MYSEDVGMLPGVFTRAQTHILKNSGISKKKKKVNSHPGNCFTFCPLFAVLSIKLGALCMADKYSTTEL
jgi:hypothetical protein